MEEEEGIFSKFKLSTFKNTKELKEKEIKKIMVAVKMQVPWRLANCRPKLYSPWYSRNMCN